VPYANARYCQQCGRPLHAPAGGHPEEPEETTASSTGAIGEGGESYHRADNPVIIPFRSPLAPPVAGIASARAQAARRPLWLLTGLTLATFGCYWYYWLGKSWSEMKEEVGDPGMDPLGHALAMFVPIYNLFRLFAHYRVINQLLARTSSPVRVQPWLPVGFTLVGPVAVLLVGALLLSIVVAVAPSSSIAALMSALLIAAYLFSAPLFSVLYGQHGLNAYWDALTGSRASYRVGLGQWLLLLIGLIIWLWVIAAVVQDFTKPTVSRI
jgi:hypothetical protein